MSRDIRLVYECNNTSPHCLLEYFIGEYRSYCTQSVVSSNLSRTYDTVTKTYATRYTNVHFSDNIQQDNVVNTHCNNNVHTVRKLDVCRLKKKYVFIIAKKEGNHAYI